MQSQRVNWSHDGGVVAEGDPLNDADLVIYFGDGEHLEDAAFIPALRAVYGKAKLFGCSTGGQIAGRDIMDSRLSAVAIRFDHTRLRAAQVMIDSPVASRDMGRKLAAELDAPDLAGMLVLSDGLAVNGSGLVAGFVERLGRSIPICGGLAGDGAAFQRTLVGLDETPRPNVIAAIGFYGPDIRIGHGSAGGWDVFGPARSITRSSANVLFELDGQPALDLYERYLGPDDIAALPGAALRYPLLIRNPECEEQTLVRSILAIDREARSMTFAGDMPRGWTAQLMRSSFERLANGAAQAATAAAGGLDIGDVGAGGAVGILISCIGRRLMLGQHVVDEIEAACASLPPQMTNLGFYSYGEISPHEATGFCELHNQTMTVVAIAEKAA
jgi:hypothetical protein